MSYKWYSGVPHIHSIASDDGKHTIEELARKAKKNKIEFLIITDHNVNCKDELPEIDGITLIYGAELTKEGGHTNLWGVKDVADSYDCETYEEWKAIKNEARRRGALVCMNHPHCVNCPWRWEKEASEVDVLEVWNAPMHYDNLICTEWWHEQMRNGYKLPVVGGSDYHKDYVVTNLIGNPVTYVYAKSNSPEDILDAIAKGRTTICNNVGKTFINITCGDFILGDTVRISDGLTAKVSVKGMKKKHTLHVFNEDGECFTFKAEKAGDYDFDIPVKKQGFLCAHTTFELSKVYEFGYNLIIGSKIPTQKGMKMPPFIYAQSGAIYFE